MIHSLSESSNFKSCITLLVQGLFNSIQIMTICDPFTLFALPFTTGIHVVNLIAMNSSNQFVIMPAKNRFNNFLNHTVTVFLTECPKPTHILCLHIALVRNWIKIRDMTFLHTKKSPLWGKTMWAINNDHGGCHSETTASFCWLLYTNINQYLTKK